MAQDHDLLKLDNQLCFSFYAASRLLTREYSKFLDPLGITYPQYLVLLVLLEQDELTVSQIGAKLMLDSGTLTPLLKRLETIEIVERSRGTEDERTVQIRLTKKGYGLRQHLQNASFKIDCILGVPEEEMIRLRELAMSVVAAAQSSNETHRQRT